MFFFWNTIYQISKLPNSIKICYIPDSKAHGANVGPTWVLSAPDRPYVGPMNFAIGDVSRRNNMKAEMYFFGPRQYALASPRHLTNNVISTSPPNNSMGKVLSGSSHNLQCEATITSSVFSQIPTKFIPYLARYGIYFVGSNYDLYYSSVAAVVYAISCCIGSLYNDTRCKKLIRLYTWNTPITE